MGKFCCDCGGWGCGLRFGLCGVALIYVYYTTPTYN